MMGGGCFISFEGVEGCGKSTQLQLLADYLRGRGIPLTVTREPGGVPIAEAIREVLLDPEHRAMTPTAELLLYAAARAQHVGELIRPAMERGDVVLCDRYADSTTAYQGGGRGLDPAQLEQLHAIATQGCWPDRTFLLDFSPEAGLERARERGRRDRIESEALEFHREVREAFLRIAEVHPRRVVCVDASRSIEAIQDDIRAATDEVLAAAGYNGES